MIEEFWNDGPTDLMVYGSIIGLFVMFFINSVWSRIIRIRLNRRIKKLEGLESRVNDLTKWSMTLHDYLSK